MGELNRAFVFLLAEMDEGDFATRIVDVNTRKDALDGVNLGLSEADMAIFEAAGAVDNIDMLAERVFPKS